eukprot:TRINITY_DN32796_c0_g1_i1.p1 TRINITY_DN32796_c0_g1~~TRINITY_DN32796_c0_g1_i1.p1  ORF type:complete len:152 (-),score=11.50 TRINITY_DN32796_c0_g1_i1:134-526(-)
MASLLAAKRAATRTFFEKSRLLTLSNGISTSSASWKVLGHQGDVRATPQAYQMPYTWHSWSEPSPSCSTSSMRLPTVSIFPEPLKDETAVVDPTPTSQSQLPMEALSKTNRLARKKKRRRMGERVSLRMR